MGHSVLDRDMAGANGLQYLGQGQDWLMGHNVSDRARANGLLYLGQGQG